MATAAVTFGATVGARSRPAGLLQALTGKRLLDPDSLLVERCLAGDDLAWEAFPEIGSLLDEPR